MKYPIRGWIRSILAMAIGFVMVICLVSCDVSSGGDGTDGNGNGTDGNGELRAIEDSDFLKAEGELVKNRKGETVMLRGVNAGGLFVIEQWMNGFAASGPTDEINIRTKDHKTTSQVFIERFGLEKAKELWKAYQENWWSEIDFENCAAMGMNCIRLPFTYMTVDFDAIVGYEYAGNYDFTPLDTFIETAASYGMYTILDLHGAYGSQNGQDHSGEVISSAADVTFYSNTRYIDLTAKLWAAIAERYKDNPAVAGYDLLNEPGEKAGSTGKKHFDVFDMLYDAIRAKDKDHIVIFESCWEGENLPQPAEYGWENCMYSFHHYTSMSGGNQYLAHAQSWNEKIANVSRRNFGIPLHMGEFNNYNDPEQWTYVLNLLNNAGWHWSSWTYKINNNWDNSAWGIYTIHAEEKVNAHTDSYEEILAKFAKFKTTVSIHKVELGDRTLESIMTEYCSAPVPKPLAPGSYIFYDTLTDMPLQIKGASPVLSDDRNAGRQFIVAAHKDGDGSVFISPAMSDEYLTVSGNDVILGPQSSAARFYPVETEYGYAFLSYKTCRYLRFDNEGRLLADGKVINDSAIFECK